MENIDIIVARLLYCEVAGKDICELLENINDLKKYCIGASIKGANGMKAKLEYISEPI